MVLTVNCVAVFWVNGPNEMDEKPFSAKYFSPSGVTAKLFAADRLSVRQGRTQRRSLEVPLTLARARLESRQTRRTCPLLIRATFPQVAVSHFLSHTACLRSRVSVRGETVCW